MDTCIQRSQTGFLTRLCSMMLCIVLLTASLQAFAVPAQAGMAWPTISKSSPIKLYTKSSGKKFRVYNSKHKKMSGQYMRSGDEVYIIGIKGKWATVQYLSNKKRKTGYAPLSTFTSATSPSEKKTAQTTVKVYRRKSGSKSTVKVAKGSTIYKLKVSNGRTQILYSVKNSSGKSAGWRMGWVSNSNYKKLTAVNKKASTLKVSGLSRPTTLIQGSVFYVKGTVSSNYKIKEIRVSITNSKGSVVSSHTVKPNTNTYSLVKIDPYILFDRAKAGTNYYKIWAKDEKKTISVNIPFTVKSGSSGGSSGKVSGPSYYLGYASYKGLNYKTQTSDKRRIAALNKAKKMATVKWKSAISFPTWYNSEGYYSSTTSTDGTTSSQFMKGKTYVGIPYSMVNHSYDDTDWANFIKNGYTWGQIAQSYYSSSHKTTAKGSDCSYFVYLCMLAGGAKVTYQTTYMMYNGKYYKKISKSSLKPGDILLSWEHVRLYAGKVGNKYAVFEATGSGSKTRYRLFTKNELSSYEAYRYKNW